MSLYSFFNRPREGASPQDAARDADLKQAGAPASDRQETINMLAIAEPGERLQSPTAFVREGFSTFSAAQANQVLLHCPFEGQRKISKDHVRVLADIMSRGGWEPKDKVDFAEIEGKLVLINGYHRMHAQVACGRPIEWTVVIHHCKTAADVRRLYYKFDTNTRIRGAEQILNGAGFGQQTGLSKSMSEALYRAVPVIAAGFSKAVRDRDVLTTRNTDRRLAMATEYVPAAKLYAECLGRLPIRLASKFRSAGVTAVALVTLRYQPVLAKQFWSGVVANDGLRKGDPRLALYNDLLSRTMNTGSSVQSIFAPSYAWNAWFDGREIKVIKVYSTSRASIAGTPFED